MAVAVAVVVRRLMRIHRGVDVAIALAGSLVKTVLLLALQEERREIIESFFPSFHGWA